MEWLGPAVASMLGAVRCSGSTESEESCKAPVNCPRPGDHAGHDRPAPRRRSQETKRPASRNAGLPSPPLRAGYFFSAGAAVIVPGVPASAMDAVTWFSIMWLPTIEANTSAGMDASVSGICFSAPARFTV